MATISSTLTLIDNMSGKLETIKKAVEDVANAFEGVSTSAENAEKQVNGFDWAGFGKKCDDFGDKATKAGAKLTLGVTTPLVALGKSAYTTATDYETAFTGIRKTTDATEEEFAALYQGILTFPKIRLRALLNWPESVKSPDSWALQRTNCWDSSKRLTHCRFPRIFRAKKAQPTWRDS